MVLRPRATAVTAAAFVLLTLASCGDSGDPTTPTPPADPTVTSVALAAREGPLELGRSWTVEAVVRRSDGSTHPNPVVAWSSNDPAVATVDAGGVVLGVGGGTARITGTVDGRSGSVDVQVLPFRVADDVTVLRAAEWEMLGDAAERAAGRYRFRWTGSGSPPAVASGRVVVGDGEGGFLRRVRTAAASGAELTLETDEAGLEDVFEEGRVSLGFALLAGAPSAAPAPAAAAATLRVESGPLRVESAAPGLRIQAVDGASLVSLDGADLCGLLFPEQGRCPGGITEFELTRGSLDLTQDFDFGFAASNGAVVEARAVVEGVLETDLDLRLLAAGPGELEREVELFTLGRIVTVWLQGVPVVAHLEAEVSGAFVAEATSAGELRGGVSGRHDLRIGADWTSSGGPEPVWEPDGDLAPEPPAAGEGTPFAAIDLAAKVVLRPTLHVKLYGMAGPALTLAPWAEASLSASDRTCAFAGAGGVDAVFDVDFADVFPGVADGAGVLRQADALDVLTPGSWECPVGPLDVSASIVGAGTDGDGFEISLDGTPTGRVVPANGSVRLDLVAIGDRRIELTGVAPNCSIQGTNPATVQVPGTGAAVAFVLDCAGAGQTGDLAVRTATTGGPIDADGYVVRVNQAQSSPIGTDDTWTLQGVGAGVATVQLTGVADHCTVAGTHPASVPVPLGGQVEHLFEVFCNGGTIRAGVDVRGVLPAGTTLRVRLGDEIRSIQPDGTESFVVAPGAWTVELLGAPEACVLTGENPRSLVVAAGEQRPVDWVLDCPPGDVVVNVTTLGNDEVTVYRVVLDGTDQLNVGAVDGSVTFPSVPNGIHSVELLDTPTECTVLGQNPRNVEAPGTTDFVVQCAADPGHVVFISGVSGDGPWRMRGDGSVPLRITDAAAGGAPRLSPDLAHVVFERGQGWGVAGLWLVGFDGSDLRPLVLDEPGPGFEGSITWHDPAWAPDSRRIVARRWANQIPGEFTGLAIIDAVTGQWAPLLDEEAQEVGGDEPDWSVLEQILFVNDGWQGRPPEIMALPSTGGSPVTVVTGAAGYQRPRWSPDGGRIAFVEIEATAGGPVGRPVVIDADGSGRVEVLTEAGGDLRVDAVTWSPDGEHLMISGVVFGQNGIFTVKTDGTELTRLRGGGLPDWRPGSPAGGGAP